MAKETLILKHYHYFSDDEKKADLKVEVEYVPTEHWDTTGERKAYNVVIDGEVVGTVTQSLANTSSPIRGTRLVRHHKGTLEWSWQRPRRPEDGKGLGPVYNAPGLYSKTRRKAVAKIMGYSDAQKVVK